ncbi:MAG: SEC-C metal-binding domain-containing protein [Elusimicrobiota bacterium]|jgi:hypothetical protein
MEAPGRNDPCRCGSGKKYKACCWEKDRAQQTEKPTPPPAPAPEAAGKSDKPHGQSWQQIIKDRHPGKKR